MSRQSIAKTYDTLADKYVKESYENHLAANSLKQFQEFLPKNSKILDVGCGGGQDSKFLAELGCNVLGIDISNEMIKLAQKLAPKAKFVNTDLSEFNSKEKFDGIWCCRVFHHVSFQEQENFLKKLGELLKSGGILYITCAVSDKNSDFEAFDSGNGNLLKKRLTPESFKSMLTDQCFEIKQSNFWNAKKAMEIFASKV